MNLMKTGVVIFALFVFGITMFNDSQVENYENTEIFTLKKNTDTYSLEYEPETISSISVENGESTELVQGEDYTLDENDIVLDSDYVYNNNDLMTIEYTYPVQERNVGTWMPYVILISFVGIGIYVVYKGK